MVQFENLMFKNCFVQLLCNFLCTVFSMCATVCFWCTIVYHGLERVKGKSDKLVLIALCDVNGTFITKRSIRFEVFKINLKINSTSKSMVNFKHLRFIFNWFEDADGIKTVSTMHDFAIRII